MTINEIAVPNGSAEDIAKWLFRKIHEVAPKHFYQDRAVRNIRDTYGPEWSYRNQNGNWAISKEILKEFGKLKATDPNILWDRGVQAWQRVSDEKLALHLEREAIKKQHKK